ncbi:hypothetical protein ASPZODRAFT_144638 [Penicilliopsis zonata CBS 506.65]|uniref:Uncharacterized protein n=1 Tax=Penicilliopsis zonata CBS 506.65 TaxID=1073090 RepID=A0A1L9SC09_9EURO|nr:hypothetical protein ASPZODRAFT_144638 [Penicilliopsis zonata CBS 506.65]OJJ44679.1 hypothetical protein ASPZODRAFT_144638 [Penicilliopsis zonata CBS 506.65]
MGIVVSGEDGNLGVSNEQQKINQIAAENDYGLFMATLDQVLVFLGSWWTSSLAGRVQTFKSYTNVPIINIIRYERTAVGVLGFHFAGIPAWAMSSCLSICRHHPLDKLIVTTQDQLLRHITNEFFSRIIKSSFSFVHFTYDPDAIRSFETYMHSILQSIHLVSPYALPGVRFFLPFSSTSLIQFPSIPQVLSLGSLSGFAASLLSSPAALVYLYCYIRPLIEVRIYRLIRRRLPKPDRADDLSLRVAFENDLIDWMVPTLGRRAEEENRRTHLTLAEDIKYELCTFKNWLLSWFDPKASWSSGSDDRSISKQERIKMLRNCIEELQGEIIAAQARTELLEQQQTGGTTLPQQQASSSGPIEQIVPTSPEWTPSTPTPAPESLFDTQVLSNEENRISQSPAEMSGDYFQERDSPRRARSHSSPAAPVGHLSNIDTQRNNEENEHSRISRSNTLFSQPSSPDTSPPTSPRVRASLIHQNSDIITMQLELLSNRNQQNRNQQSERPSAAGEEQGQVSVTTDHGSITELLDALLSTQEQNLTQHHSDVGDSDGLSSLTAGVSPTSADLPPVPVPQPQSHTIPAEDTIFESPVEVPISSLANILPDGIEEPPIDDIENQTPGPTSSLENQLDTESRPPMSHSNAHRRSITSQSSSLAHRVTILSSHPVDSLASHLASMITTALLFPLESLYLRSLARTYLSLAGSSVVFRSDVRDLGAWFGGGSRSDMVMYMGKVCMLVGIQTAVNAGVWGVVTSLAMKLGRALCGWGTF